MRLTSISLRPGEPGDAVSIAALSVQVFLDTYATEGVRSDLAREAFREYSEQAFLARLSQRSRRFVLAEVEESLIGFAELESLRDAPVQDVSGWELVRLYVQPQAQRLGAGTALLKRSEEIALDAGARSLWLSVWEGNARALAFYSAMGYADVGATTHAFEGRQYGNRLVAKRLLEAQDIGGFGMTQESGSQAPQVPPEVARYLKGVSPEGRQFDFLIGDWDVAATRYKEDGSTLFQYRASWNAKYLDEGRMVLDDFKAYAPTGQAVSSYVTLRTYSETTKRWEMAGLSALQPAGSAEWYGEWKDGEMLLHANGRDPAGHLVRTEIRFFNIAMNSFEWESIASRDDGRTWVKSASLFASRVAP